MRSRPRPRPRSRPDSGWLLFRSTVIAQLGPPQAPSSPHPSTRHPDRAPYCNSTRKCPLPRPRSTPTPPRAMRLVLEDPPSSTRALGSNAETSSASIPRLEPLAPSADDSSLHPTPGHSWVPHVRTLQDSPHSGAPPLTGAPSGPSEPSSHSEVLPRTSAPDPSEGRLGVRGLS